MDKELLKGNMDIFLLALLSKRPMYGYEICKEIKSLTDDNYQLGEGTLYPALKRLEEKRYLEAYWEKVQQKDLQRKYYKITESGICEMQKKIESWFLINKLIKKLLSVEV